MLTFRYAYISNFFGGFYCDAVGLIYGMDFNSDDNVIYYGDRDSLSIFQVSVNRLSLLQDDRRLLLNNTRVWDLSYDWINEHLYWTDDR